MQTYGFKGPGLDKILTSADSVPLNEYFQYAPGDVMQRYRPQIVQRMTMGSTASWRPLAWLSNEMTAGVDLADRDNSDLCRLGECAPTGVIRLGAVSDRKNNNRTVSAKLTSTASWNPRPWANFKTSAGADYVDTESDSTTASGVTLPPGGMSVGQAATRDGGQG